MEQDSSDVVLRVADLEDSLDEIEKRLERLESFAGRLGYAATRGVGVQPRPIHERPPEPAAARPEETEGEQDQMPSTRPATEPTRRLIAFPVLSSELEVVIGTSWLNRIGIIAIIAAAAYFLKYSFDNDWIGPVGRVALAIVTGLALLGLGERFQRKHLEIFAQGLTGGGLAILYLAVYSAVAIYGLVSFVGGMVGAVTVTVAAVALSLRYNSMAIAMLGLVAGFVAPLALGRPSGPAGGPGGGPITRALYAYFALMDVAAYSLVRRQGWPEFGVAALGLAYAVPVAVAAAATPPAVAVSLYFLALSLAVLALAVRRNLPQLIWIALGGGMLLNLQAGATTLFDPFPTFMMAYYTILGLAAAFAATRLDSPQAGAIGPAAALLVAALASNTYPLLAFLDLGLVTAVAVLLAQRNPRRQVDLFLILAAGVAALIAILAIDSEIQNSSLRPLGLMLSGVTMLFLFASLVSAAASREHTELRIPSIIAAAAFYSAQLYAILGPDVPATLALAALSLAAYHALLSWTLWRRKYPGLAVLLPLALALTYVTAAIPLRFQGPTVPIAWAVESAALAWVAARTTSSWAGRGAVAVSALLVWLLLTDQVPRLAVAERVIFSGPGLAFAAAIASCAVQAVLLRPIQWKIKTEAFVPAVLASVSAALLFLWGTLEISAMFGRIGGALTQAGAGAFALSAWFTLFALGLVVVGIWKNLAVVRWAGIGLLGVTVLKIFVIDLAQVTVVFRILSLAVLGILMLLASLAYSRWRERIAEKEQGGSA